MAAENRKVSLFVEPLYVSVDVLTPVYRLDFWNKHRDSTEHRLENVAYVDDALSGAETNRIGRQAMIRVECDYDGGTGMCRQHGLEPIDADQVP